MITDQILNIIYYFIYNITGILPTGNLPAEVGNTITTMAGYLKYIKTIFPVDTLLEVLTLILTIEAALLTYYFIMWVIHRIPGE